MSTCTGITTTTGLVSSSCTGTTTTAGLFSTTCTGTTTTTGLVSATCTGTTTTAGSCTCAGRVCFGLMNPSFEIFYKNIVPYMTTDLLMEKMSWAIFYNDLAPLQNELYSLVISQATIGVVLKNPVKSQKCLTGGVSGT